MKIRNKIILTVLPLFILAMSINGISSALSARNGLTEMAVRFLGFKAEELESYSQSQWSLLINNGLQDRQDLIEITKQSIAMHSVMLTRSDTELTLFLDKGKDKSYANKPFDMNNASDAEKEVLRELYEESYKGWVELSLSGVKRVGYIYNFKPLDWLVLVTEEEDVFYEPVNQIIFRTVIILLSSLVVIIILLFIFTGLIIDPLNKVVLAMDKIISSGDADQQVTVQNNDEIGKLAHTFNLTMNQLNGAYTSIKQFALEAVVARKSEQKTRHIFQKFVPADVIESIFKNPEKMLVGDTRDIAILFTDIRSFTTISECYEPDELVNNLNRYFSIIVDSIISSNGIVDKYIGDAVMAFFGAPIQKENDCRDALKAALAISHKLVSFNNNLEQNGKHKFITGIGLNFGTVTVGNIGTDKKMDYTVIGDNVNLASRIEGLTKEYKQEILISESIKDKAGNFFNYRMVDTVIVKGKTKGAKVFTASDRLSNIEADCWNKHNRAMEFFYQKDFSSALKLFREVNQLMENDYLSELYIERCNFMTDNPPDTDWHGIMTMTHK